MGLPESDRGVLFFRLRNALFFFYKNSMTLNQVCSTLIISIQNEKTVDKKTSVTAIDIKFGCFLKRKLTAEAGHKAYSPWNNSPWNIAADFIVDMSFSVKDITGMLIEYESDHKTGMNVNQIAEMLYEYTSGYPFLVSRLCKLIDERISGSTEFQDKRAAWTRRGFLKAVRR